MRFYIKIGKGTILIAQKLTNDKKRNSSGFGWGCLAPSPILDDDVPATQCSTRTSGHINAWSRATWSSCSSAAPLPALLEVVEPPLWQALIPATETSGQCPQDCTSARPSRLYPPLPVSTDGKGEENTGIRQRLHSSKEQGERTPVQMPLREFQKPPVRDACGHYHPHPPLPTGAYYYQPFSSTDTLNWQKHAPPYSGEPQAMIRLTETIFWTHCPT